MNDKEWKEKSIKEFTKAANKYETDEAGIYKLCRKDYPAILEELEKEPFNDLLDVGCGTGPMISLLSKKYPDKHYTGLDLTPAMIEEAKKKNIPNANFIVGDAENLPFEDESFDAMICSNSIHHYPNPQAFFGGVRRCLRKGGRLIIRDFSSNNPFIAFFMNHIELPICNLFGHGDVEIASIKMIERCCKECGLTVEVAEIRKGMKLHCVVRKGLE